MASRGGGGASGGGGGGGAESYDSSSSASSDDAVLITSKQRKKLQLQQLSGSASGSAKEAKAAAKAATSAKSPVAAPPATPSAASGKPDHICGVCERDGGALVVCAGSCVSAFHVACLGPQAGDTAAAGWKCPSCVAGTHVCFHCKQRGLAAGDDPAAAGTATATATTAAPSPPLRAVVKCRALSCGKFYHEDCIAKLPLARIAGSRFICPLHTCAACEQSGAKKEPVRCTRCPVAYHTSCLPRTGVVPLPGKRIICPKHDGALPPTLEIAASANKTTGEHGADDDAVEEGEVEEGEEHEEAEEQQEKTEQPPAAVKPAPPLSRVVSTTEDNDAALSVAASSPRTEENDDDARSDTSATGGSSKKHSKSSKKDKKKKKKKKKKEKKKDKERTKSGGADGDAMSDKEDGAKKSDKLRKTSKSSKAERGLSDDEAVGGEDKGHDDKTAGTASGDDGEEQKALVVDVPMPVENEREVAASSHPMSPHKPSEPPQAAGSDTALSASEEDKRPAGQTPATQDAVDEMKAEPQPNEDAEAARVESKRKPSDGVQPQVPQLTPVDPVVVDTNPSVREDEEPKSHRSDEAQPVSSSLPSDTPASPVKVEQTDRQGEHTADEKRENLTVKIPEVSAGGHGEDGEADEDSGSGSGSQSAKARHANRTDEVQKERSGGSSRSKKNKKKRKGGRGEDTSKRVLGGEDDGGEAEPKDEAKWVQCDDCKKWRTVAKEIDLDAMPETWYCKMNTWNKAVASCDIPEEVVETKKSKSSKRSVALVGEVVTPVPKKAKLAKQVSVPEPPPADEADSGSVDKEKAAVTAVKKKADKDSKKRKLKLKLREKYGEVNWVQCENKQCAKWRVVPSSANALPSVWYCNLNTWAPELASCSAANPPDVEAYLLNSQSKKPSSTRPAKRQRGQDSHEVSGGGAASGQTEVAIKPAGIKASKSAAKSTTPTAHVTAATASSGGAPAAGASASSQNIAAADDGRSAKAALAGVKSVVLEWAQCEKCLKWRKLPAHIKSSTLPDKWYCSMNHWDPSRASCSLPQEEDQEPIDASPLPSSQNWYPMPGQVGGSSSTGGSSVRAKRGKLSYSELLYASTGQLRKTYTSDSSTLSFEYEGVVYHRDDQYKRSSMYVSPLTTNKISGEQIDPQSEALKVKDFALQFAAPAMQELVDRVAKAILSKIDLRRDFAVTEIVDSVLCDSDVGSGDLSLSVITSAIAQLVTAGELEKVDRSSSSHITPPREVSSTPTSILLGSLSSQTAHYRKVPKRPLKALKAWKLAANL